MHKYGLHIDQLNPSVQKSSEWTKHKIQLVLKYPLLSYILEKWIKKQLKKYKFSNLSCISSHLPEPLDK